MSLFVLLLVTALSLTACLELTPNVSTEFSELEARVVLEREFTKLCAGKRSRLKMILASLAEAEASPTTDHWVFRIGDEEVVIFPSGVVGGSYVKSVETRICR